MGATKRKRYTCIRNRGISRGGRKSEGKTRSCYFRGYRKIDLPYEEGQFDCVLFGDVLEHLFDPWAVIEKVKPYIKQNGVILASIPNVAHISVLAPLLAGNWTYTEYGLLDKTHIRFFTFNEMLRMFLKAGYSISKVDRVYVDHKMYEPLIEELYGICKNIVLEVASWLRQLYFSILLKLKNHNYESLQTKQYYLLHA